VKAAHLTQPAVGRRFRAYTAKHLDTLTERAGLPEETRLAVRAVATVLPFRTNSYVTEQLIDWDNAPDDPIYRLVFPQPDMLPPDDVDRLSAALSRGADAAAVRRLAHEVRMRLNPHPAGQLALNAAALDDEPLPGLQHKYPETVLFFPRQGDRPATPTAPTVSGGLSSSTSRTSRWPRTTSAHW
jgi:L-lysine 2,3-aminomutase